MKKSPWKLDPLFTPRSIAVIGASPNGGAGSIVLRNMQRLGYTGTVYPINPKYKEIFGYPCYASLRDLPAPADCAAVLLGSRSLLPMLEEAHAAGVKGVWGFASGFAETGGEGRAMQRRIHDFCHESGLLFCGPNCVGYANITDKTCMYSAPLPQAFRPGDIGVIAQSGAVLLALGNANRMAGFSRLISSGNEAALGLADYMDYLVDDDATHVIALFIETIRDPEAFAAACSRAAEKGKPVIALKVGRSELACRVAATHTGAIAGSDRILDAFFRRANVMRVNTLDDLLETAVLFSGLRGLSAGSPKVGMATVSGGEMGMLADVCADSGLVFPPVSEAGKERLRKVLPPTPPSPTPSTRGAAAICARPTPPASASSPPRRMWKRSSSRRTSPATWPPNRWSSSRTWPAPLSPCAPPPASRSSSFPISPAASIRPSAISSHKATSPWCRAAARASPPSGAG
ncbi:MAG: CoA-binding protein [Bilophila wadsworthia]